MADKRKYNRRPFTHYMQVLYTDLGHSGSGTNRTENGRFSTLDAASNRLIQECSGWDRTWEA
jgi:hypothetical protein